MKKIIVILLLLGFISQSFVVFANTGSGSLQNTIGLQGVDEEISLFTTQILPANEQGLIAEYYLNGNTDDSSINDNYGIKNNITYTTLENGNKVANFNGSNSTIYINDLGTLTAVTQCAAIKYSENLGNGIVNLGKYHYSNNFNTIRLNARNRLTFSIPSGNSSLTNATDGNNYNDGEWHIVCGTWDSNSDGKARLYVDGTLVGTSVGSKNTPFISPISYGHIGGYAVDGDTTNPTWKFNGDLGFVRIYNKALSQDEISDLYDEGQKYLFGEPSSLIASYDLNGNTEDVSGNGNHLTNHQSILTTDRNNTVDSAYYLNGNSSHLSLPQLINGIKSISLWVAKDDLSSSSNMLFTYLDYTKYYGQVHANGNLYFNFGGSNKSVPHGLNVNDNGKWHHFTFTADGVNVSVYKNGNLIGSFPENNFFDIKNIGFRDHLGGDYHFGGKLDDITLYATTLTQSEVEALYQEGQTDPLIAYYDLNGNADDSSGNENHGTERNITYITLENGNKVASFDGAASKIYTQTPFELEGMSLWIKPDGEINSSSTNGIAGLGSDYYGVRLGTVTQNVENEIITIVDGGNSDIFYWDTSDISSITPEWHHITLTWESTSSNYRLYYNGIDKGLANKFGNPGQIHLSTFGPYRTYQYFDGNISGINIFNTELYQPEINQLYQEGQEYLGLNQPEPTPTLESPLTPTNFVTTNIATTTVGYNWEDVATDNTQETKYVLKDENNVILIDGIPADSISITETGLSPNTNYQRKICAINVEGESCSTLVSFTTAVEVSGATETLFDFAGITIAVIETSDMFKIEFSIGGFKINFSIEQV